MSDNLTTRYTRGYQTRNNAMGLCRACTNPLDEDSVQLCPSHLEKQREANRKKTGGKPSGWKMHCVTNALKNVTEIEDVKTLAHALSVAPKMIYEAAGTLGIPTPTTVRRRKLVELLRKNPTAAFDEIARIAGISVTTVYHVAHTSGVRPRIRGPYQARQK